MDSILISAIVTILSFALLIFLTYRGYGAILAPVICTILAGCVTQTGLVEAVFTVFPSGVASFIERIIMPSISGVVLGEVMANSGVGHSIGLLVTDKIGINRAPYVILITTIIVMLTGMNMAIFLIAALSHALLKAADLPAYIGLACYFGVADVTVFCMPGVATNANILPAAYLDTDLYADFIPALFATLCGYAIVIFYIRYLVLQARQKGIGYTARKNCGNLRKVEAENLPPSTLGIAAIFIVIIMTLIIQKVLGLSAPLAVFVSQITAAAFISITCRTYFTKASAEMAESVVSRVGSFLITAGCMVGYATVITNTSFFIRLQTMLSNMEMNPYLFTVIAVALISAVSAEANTGMLLYLEGFGQSIINVAGVNAGVIHRLTTMTATAFDSLPHGGFVLIALQLFGYHHKDGYRYVFISGVLIPLIVTLITLIIAMFFQ